MVVLGPQRFPVLNVSGSHLESSAGGVHMAIAAGFLIVTARSVQSRRLSVVRDTGAARAFPQVTLWVRTTNIGNYFVSRPRTSKTLRNCSISPVRSTNCSSTNETRETKQTPCALNRAFMRCVMSYTAVLCSQCHQPILLDTGRRITVGGGATPCEDFSKE
jgi:hypothetical protein